MTAKIDYRKRARELASQVAGLTRELITSQVTAAGLQRELKETRDSWNKDHMDLDLTAVRLRADLASARVDAESFGKRVDVLTRELEQTKFREESFKQIARIREGRIVDLDAQLTRALDAGFALLAMIPQKPLDKPADTAYIVRRGFTKPYKEVVRR